MVIIYLVVENVFAKESGKTSPRYLWAWPSGQSMFIFFCKGLGSCSVPGGCKVLVVENVFTKESRKDVAAPLVGVAQWLKYAYLERWIRVRYPMLPTC